MTARRQSRERGRTADRGQSVPAEERGSSGALLSVYLGAVGLIGFVVGLWRIIAGLRFSDGRMLDFVSLGFLLTPVIAALLANASEISLGSDGLSWKRAVTTKLDSADATLKELNVVVERLKAITSQGVGKRRRSLNAIAGPPQSDALLRELLADTRIAGLSPGKSLHASSHTESAADKTEAPAFPSSAPGVRPDDPQKGRWGGGSERNHRRLAASVSALDDDPEMFEIALVVTSTDPSTHPLSGNVRFHLHDTFDPDVVRSTVRNGVARLVRYAWGAFTVGAEADDGATTLELDLSTLPDVPQVFRES